jgi:tetratricopeptide (TPR) repeat protein
MRSAEARGESSVAAASFTSFVADPAHRGTRALARAWRLQGDRDRAAGARDAALQAYARAYLEAHDPAETTTLLRTMAEMFREDWDGLALAQALATLNERGLAVPSDAALALDAALLQGDLAAAAVAARSDDRPGSRAWGALFAALAPSRATGLSGRRMVALPAGGPAAFAALDPTEQELLLLDPTLAPVGRLPAAGRRLTLVEDSGWVLAAADGQGELIDLAAPRVPLWRGPTSGAYLARALDLDGDGARELLFGRSWPDLGFRALTGLGGPDARERVAHASTDASHSELSALWVGDLDGDGTQELVAAIGPWNAFDLRVFHGDAQGRLELVARRSFGRITGLASLRRGDERLLVALNDEHCPIPELFPLAPHTGAPAGVHLLRWDGAALIDADFLPLPRGRASDPITAGRVLLAADLDGDATEELILQLDHVGAGMTLIVRQDDQGLEARRIHGIRPLATAQLDADPAHELLVHTDPHGEIWALGTGDATPPLQPPTPIQRQVPRTLADPLLVERWTRADELAGLGLLAPAAASLGEAAGFTADRHARRDLLGQAANLLARAGDDAGVVALTTHAGRDPGPEALAHGAAALARLGRHEEAYRAAAQLAGHPARTAAELAEAELLRARLAPLVAPGARIDVDLGALAPAWRFERPASLRGDPNRRALELTIPSSEQPVAELPIAWDGGPIALEYELDLERLEYGACLRVGLLDHNDTIWLGAGVCGIGGGGRLMYVDGCKLGGVGWSEFPEEPMASTVVARKLVVRVAAFPDGTAECSVDDGVRRRSKADTGPVLPLPGPQRLAVGAFLTSGEPALATGALRRVTIHGARELPPQDEPTPQAVAARLLVEGEPAAALAALDAAVVTDPRDALLRVFAYNDLRDPDGLTRTTPELLPQLDDPTWLAELTLLLRTRPAAAMALQHAAKGRLLPTLARAWRVTGTLAHDPELQRSALAELGNIDHLRPVTPAEQLALLALLTLRGDVRQQLGHREQARDDFEAALAVPTTTQPGDTEARVRTHLRLARLLAPSDPEAAQAHAAAAAALSPTPELVHDRLATIPGLR